jgi:hypothetical protein
MTEQPGDRTEQASDTPMNTPTNTPTNSATKSTAEAPPRSRGTRTRVGSPRYGWRRIRDALATAVVIVAAAVAIILAVHVVFVVFEANGANGIVKTINSWADFFAWNFKDIFTPTDPKAAALVNYGLAAAVYLIVGRVLAALIRRAG